MAARSKYFSSLQENVLLEEPKPGESIEYMLDILVDADALVALVKVNEPNHERALTLKDKHIYLADNWFNKQSKKGTSYFDCYNMALLERYGKQLNGIFSFDGVYKRNGFKMADGII